MILLFSGIFLGLGWFAAHAGVVPILGPLVATFAPDVFLIGLVLLAIWIAKKFATKKITVGGLAAVLSIVMGLNTRLPTIMSDVLSDRASDRQVIARLEGAVGQSIHVVAPQAELSARRDPYSHAVPACYGDGCLATKGFSTAYPGIERHYWHEKVMDVVLASGFSKATQGESAPTLTIGQEQDDYFVTIRIQLTDANGKAMSHYRGRYRNRFPYETKDGVQSIEAESPLVLEYLLHGNLLNRIAARRAPNGDSYPLTAFLKSASHLTHPQGLIFDLISGMPPTNNESSSEKIRLEILEEKVYDPVWVIKEEPMSNVSKWSELTWDSKRDERCKTLLKPEIDGAPQLQTWHLFVNDLSGRKKVRYTGIAICDPDAIWFLDYVIEKGRTVLTKYSANGDLIYRVGFDKPIEPYGYPGGIIFRTFTVENGYLQFEWWNTNQSGRDMHVKRSLKVRFREPSR